MCRINILIFWILIVDIYNAEVCVHRHLWLLLNYWDNFLEWLWIRRAAFSCPTRLTRTTRFVLWSCLTTWLKFSWCCLSWCLVFSDRWPTASYVRRLISCWNSGCWRRCCCTQSVVATLQICLSVFLPFLLSFLHFLKLSLMWSETRWLLHILFSRCGWFCFQCLLTILLVFNLI